MPQCLGAEKCFFGYLKVKLWRFKVLESYLWLKRSGSLLTTPVQSIAQRIFWNLKCLRSFRRIYHLGNVGPVIWAKDNGNDAGRSNVQILFGTCDTTGLDCVRVPVGLNRLTCLKFRPPLACSVTYFWFHGCAVGHHRRSHQTRRACFCGTGSLALVIELNCDFFFLFCSILLALKSDAFETTGQWLCCISRVLLAFLGS